MKGKKAFIFTKEGIGKVLKASFQMEQKEKRKDGTFKIVLADNTLSVIKMYDLCTKEHTETRIIELEGEQEAIAISNNGKALP
mgnify:CR=1 FL=1